MSTGLLVSVFPGLEVGVVVTLSRITFFPVRRSARHTLLRCLETWSSVSSFFGISFLTATVFSSHLILPNLLSYLLAPRLRTSSGRRPRPLLGPLSVCPTRSSDRIGVLRTHAVLAAAEPTCCRYVGEGGGGGWRGVGAGLFRRFETPEQSSPLTSCRRYDSRWRLPSPWSDVVPEFSLLDASIPVFLGSARLSCAWSIRREVLHHCCDGAGLICPVVVMIALVISSRVGLTAAVNASAVTRQLSSCLGWSASGCMSA